MTQENEIIHIYASQGNYFSDLIGRLIDISPIGKMADIVDLADSDEDDCVQIVNQLQAAVVPAQKSFSCPICRYKAQDQKDILQHILQQVSY